jgi:hypothetical protein
MKVRSIRTTKSGKKNRESVKHMLLSENEIFWSQTAKVVHPFTNQTSSKVISKLKETSIRETGDTATKGLQPAGHVDVPPSVKKKKKSKYNNQREAAVLIY